MIDYEFTAKVSAEDAEAARDVIANLLLCFGSKVHVFVKPKGETYKQMGYGKWYDREETPDAHLVEVRIYGQNKPRIP